MGLYLVKDRALVAPAPMPFRVSESGILLVHPVEGDEPWAIGSGGDAASPYPPEIAPDPARDFEMRFDASAGEAAVYLWNSDSRQGFHISYSAGLWGNGLPAGFVETEVARNLQNPLSIRFQNKTLQLIDGLGAAIVTYTAADLDIVDWNAFLPLAFSATNNYPQGNSRHCMGMDAVIDIMYDGILEEGSPEFWTSFNQTREVR